MATKPILPGEKLTFSYATHPRSWCTGCKGCFDEPEILHDTAAVVAAIEEVTVDKTFDADKDFDVDNLEHLDADDLLFLLDTINLPFGELANWR